MEDLNVPGSAGVMRVHSQRASAQYYREALDRVLAALGWTNVPGEGRGQPFDVVWWDEPIRRPHLLMLPEQVRVFTCH